MKLVFLIDHMKFSGGRKLFLEYAKYLIEAGHLVTILAKEKRGELIDFVPVSYVKSFNDKTIPDCDLIVTTTHREVVAAVESKKAEVVHFCQGYEITDLEQRLSGEVLPARYQKKEIMTKLKLFKKKFSWKKKLEHFDQVYKLPTHLVTISKHLQKELKKRYLRPVKLCRNGIHQQFFYPVAEQEWFLPNISKGRPLKIISIGPHNVSFKGIPTTLKAIEIMKSKDLPIHFTRITPNATDADENNPNIDQLFTSLSQKEMGDVLRDSDVYVSNSTEGEGFGLPAMEALSCGVICVLSSISSYTNFDDSKDFCYFVPEHDVWATVNAIEQIIGAGAGHVKEVRKKGLEVAANFSHEKACQHFEQILNDILHEAQKAKDEDSEDNVKPETD